ncbi:phage holin family protein [Halodesulfovibrio aestuarii]|uniref:Holin family protein n=1 Tax=Halodesulfovibrio aestuarii TaxID=126333 RepID=A0ABV4JX59_9BACT
MQNLLSSYFQDLTTNADIKAILGAFGGCLAVLFGGVYPLVNALVALWALDFVLGIKRAWDENKLSARKARRGVRKMFMYLVTVVVMGLVEYAMGAAGKLLSPCSLTVSFLCAHEGLSCLSHLSHFGVPIPKKLVDRLRNYRDEINDGTMPQGGEK